MTETGDLKQTPLYDRFAALGARMVPFAGYAMPVQFETGIIQEHLWTREHAGLFDVSHMGQAILRPKDGGDAGRALEALIPGDLQNLGEGRSRYTLLLTESGGIRDDMVATRLPGGDGAIFLVVNAAFKDQDLGHIEASLGDRISLERLDDRALIALQGPEAAEVFKEFSGLPDELIFMSGDFDDIAGARCFVTRSGYTGEDGFELSVPAADADRIVGRLLDDERVHLVGLGARDSLRLEAGLSLSGHDIDETTSPVEAGLNFAISKSRREGGDFPGAERILIELAEGPERLRVGMLLDGRAPAREGAEISDAGGAPIGQVTSGGFGPSLQRAIAMGYVSASHAEPGARVGLNVRGRILPGAVASMPFVAPRYVRKKGQ